MARVAAGDGAGLVREEIGASWRRSANSGLRPDTFEVPRIEDVEADGPLVHAARPVLDQLASDLAATSMAVVVTDSTGNVLDRRVSEPPLEHRLDRILLAPGFSYAEDCVGTNAIGTALEQRRSSIVAGGEHFADALITMTCAAAPVADPRSGRILGAVDLTCGARDGSPLMLTLATRAAREIEDRLVDGAGVSERVLLQRFLRERRGAKGPLVLVNGSTMITNAAADRVVEPGDEAVLWDCARRLLNSNQSSADVVLTGGRSVAVACQSVLDGGVLTAAVLRLKVSAPLVAHDAERGDKPAYGWETLTVTECSVTELVSQGLTNREAAEQLFMSPYTVDSHLRSIFRKLDVRSRIELARIVLQRARTA